jgi:hypothetical protein
VKNVASLLGVAAIAVAVLTCSEPGALGPDAASGPPTYLTGLVISNSHTITSATSVARASASVADNAAVVFVSLAPGTLPGALEIEIENRTHSSPASVVSVVDGGFDPVRVQAVEGDTLALTPRMSDHRAHPILVKVPAKRPPSVVRTKPSKGRTDVALNVIVAVVFTEPVDRTTVNASSIQLLRDGKPVSGEARLNEDLWIAEFLPDDDLEPGATYELVVTNQVRDQDGDGLDVELSSTFVTGTARCAEALAERGCLPGTDESRSIRGTVAQRTAVDGIRPVSNAKISAWVWVTDTTGYGLKPIHSDENGSYSLTSLPARNIQLYAEADGLDQICAVAAKPSLEAHTVDIRLVESGSLAIWGFLEDDYTAWGTVYENFETKTPLPGARILYEAPENVIVASARTDVAGKFGLCDLPDLGRHGFGNTFLSVAKPGFETLRMYWPAGVWGYMTMTRVTP